MTADWILAWYNLVFVLPFLLALIYLFVYAASGLTFGEAEADLGADGDAGGGEAEMDAGADHDVASHAHHAPDLPILMRVMGLLGGREVPLSIVLMVLFFTWGLLGFIANNLLRPLVPAPWMVALASLPGAAVGSFLFTRAISRTVARWMPTNETYVKKKSELVGSLGEAVFSIDRAGGTASVRDRGGDLFQVPCRIYEDGRPIPKGSRIILVDYDPREKVYYVTLSDLKAIVE